MNCSIPDHAAPSPISPVRRREPGTTYYMYIQGPGDIMNKKQSQASDANKNGQGAPSSLALLENEDHATLVRYYHQMLFLRHFEEKAAEMYSKARIGGYCHLNLGEEATVIGFCEGFDPDDYVYT